MIRSLFIAIGYMMSLSLHAVQLESIYTQKPVDSEAFYFTPENYNIKADGKTDVSDELQAAINRLKTENAFGILFIPEGKYLISKTFVITTKSLFSIRI